MRITLVSIHVEDQDRALAFYRDVLGFVAKVDIPMGPYRWLTVVAPDRLDGPELVLEPNAHPAARAYQDALLRDGIPVTSFEVDDVDAEHRRLRGKGVAFTRPPSDAGPVRVAVFADTCGNLVQIPRPAIGRLSALRARPARRVEAAGIEPASGSLPPFDPTCVVRDLLVERRAGTDALSSTPSWKSLAVRVQALPDGQPAF